MSADGRWQVAREWGRRALWGLERALLACGQAGAGLMGWIIPYPQDEPARRPEPRPGHLPAHPERLASHVPPTPVERELWAQLTDRHPEEGKP